MRAGGLSSNLLMSRQALIAQLPTTREPPEDGDVCGICLEGPEPPPSPAVGGEGAYLPAVGGELGPGAEVLMGELGPRAGGLGGELGPRAGELGGEASGDSVARPPSGARLELPGDVGGETDMAQPGVRCPTAPRVASAAGPLWKVAETTTPLI